MKAQLEILNNHVLGKQNNMNERPKLGAPKKMIRYDFKLLTNQERKDAARMSKDDLLRSFDEILTHILNNK